MADLESAAAAVIAQLVAGEPLTEERREVLAWFIALQWSRSRWVLTWLRSQVRAARGESDPRFSAEYRSVGLIAVLAPLLEAWRMRGNPSAGPKEKWNAIVSEVWRMDWKLQRYAGRSLVVSDAVVALSGTVEESVPAVVQRWSMHGIEVGFGTCKRLTMPLAPNLGVLATRGVHPVRIDAQRFNRYTVYNSREWVAYAPDWPSEKPRLHRSVIENLSLQRILRPMMGDSD